MTDEKTIQTLAKYLADSSAFIDAIILFGSRARGDADLRSDIDLAVKCPHASQREWLDICSNAEAFDTLLKIDLVRWDEAPQKLKDNIENEGITLYDKQKN